VLRGKLSQKRIRTIKPEIRVLAIDDGVFTPHKRGKALVVGIVFRGGYWLDGVMHTHVTVDGLDATEKISSMIMDSPHFQQLRVIMLNGITFAGFNVVNIQTLNQKTNLPVIAVTRDKPDLTTIEKAIENLSRRKARWKAITAAGECFELATRKPAEAVFLHVAGLKTVDAERIVKLTSTRSSIPEALRVAHIVASGITHS
jgi:hypothetical protein